MIRLARPVSLSHLAVLSIEGEEAQSFLQAQLTSDIKGLEAEQAVQYTGYCSPKGRLLANGYIVYSHPQQYYWIMHESIIDRVLKRLTMFILRTKVRLERLDWKVYGECLALNPSDAHPHSFQILEQTPSSMTLQLPYGRRCQALSPSLAQALEATLTTDESMNTALAIEWDQRTLAAQEVWINDPLYEELIPQMIEWDRLGGVSFKKGCYPGQEIVARTHYLGKMKRRLFYAESEGDIPAIGTAIELQSSTEQEAVQTVGQVVGNAFRSSNTGPGAQVLVVLSTDFVQTDTILYLHPKDASESRRTLNQLVPCFSSPDAKTS
jgi:tRNA-modifying protein YgfZ